MPEAPTDPGPALLAVARAAIAHELGLGPAPDSGADPALGERGACFVTLTIDGELRGCIGSLKPQRPLGEDVAHNAVGAAMHDPRFAPLSAVEFERVRIGVSRLSDAEFLDFSDEADLLRQLRPGIDGLIIFSSCRSATFLPQVWDSLPEPERFLAALKHKAGFDPAKPVAGLMAARYTVEKWEEAPQEA